AGEQRAGLAVQMMMVNEVAVRESRAVVDEVRVAASRHLLEIGAEGMLDLGRIEITHPARHGHADQHDRDAGGTAPGQEAAERPGLAAQPVAPEPPARLANAR